MSQAVEALGAHQLQLRRIGERRYVVTRSATAARPTVRLGVTTPRADPESEPSEEVSVFASRYRYDTQASGQPVGFDERGFRDTPGAQGDSIRAVRTAPGLATNLSARPFIRGAMLDDVLIRFDGITLVDPFHFKTFQSLLSVFDPLAVSHVDVYTGGFPVSFGDRSAGVLDLTPRSIDAGSEYAVSANLLSTDLASVGRANRWPLEWLVTLRHSTDKPVLQPIDGEHGNPIFLDALARVRWQTGAASALTVGWLGLHDQFEFASDAREESANVRSRDGTAWFSWDYGPASALYAHTSLALTHSERTRSGSESLSSVGTGNLYERRDFSIAEFRSDWTYSPDAALTWTFGAELGQERAHLTFARQEQFAHLIAVAFALPVAVTEIADQAPRSATWGLFASSRRRWRRFEAEVGVRIDHQAYERFERQTQVSPRVNLRFDPTKVWHLYGSWGHFAQAQRVDEWRSEENQTKPDAASRATHLIAGTTYEGASGLYLRLEAYRNHWSAISPYFDNTLDTVSLVPELEPDRLLITPTDAEAAGIELSARSPVGSDYSIWGTYTLSQVTDDLLGHYILRSWDQRQALGIGLAWSHARTSASLLIGWHSGWPRTALSVVPATASTASYLVVGPRNANRWGAYLSADIRVSKTVPLQYGELSLWLDATNVSNGSNECCLELGPTNPATGIPLPTTRYWFPRLINAGFTWRMHRPG